MRTIHLSLWLVFFSLAVHAQPTSIRIKNGCAYNNVQKEKDLVVYDASEEAERIVHEIMEVLGLSQNFVLKASGVKNAIATSVNGQRYILYSTIFLEQFKTDANTRWAAYTVLAHEIGHHLNYHDFGEPDARKRKMCELEADRFSGSILRMLDATLEEAEAGVNTIELEGETASHPSKSLRREAIAMGWKRKDEQLQNISGVNRFADSDGDNVPDSRDACPDIYGTHVSGCPDADEDGIPNRDDKCPFEKGLPAYKGCPDPSLADRDGDMVPDKTDDCPDQKGERRYAGCPDTDGDGLPNNVDKCPTEKGEALNNGCPQNFNSPFKKEDDLNPVEPKDVRSDEKKEGIRLNNMIFVKGGSFSMGCQNGRDKDCFDWEKPAHIVVLSDFQIGEYEVTQAEWTRVMGNNPSSNSCLNCPVEGVSWNDVQEFLRKLNGSLPEGIKKYRLPTEAEWEYAARGGQLSKGYLYSGSNTTADVGWYKDNSDNKTQSVGGLKSNELGIFDMSGNVYEWCADDWQDNYNNTPIDGNSWIGNPRGSLRVHRGGSWNDAKYSCRSSFRYYDTPGKRYSNIGFRLAQD